MKFYENYFCNKNLNFISKKAKNRLFSKEPSFIFKERFLVEARRVELLSENHLPRVSPSAVDVLNFPCRIAHRQAMRFGSSLCVTRLGAIPCSHLPLIDAPYTAAVLRAGTSSLRC